MPLPSGLGFATSSLRKELEFPQESPFGRRKRPGASQRGICLKKRDRLVVSPLGGQTCAKKPHLGGKGRLLEYVSSYLLFKPELHAKTLEMG